MNPLTVLSLGLLLGLKHATDTDHVVAVTTIVSHQRKLRHAAMVGMSWGIGHTLMIMVVGIAIILFHLVIPEKIQQTFEFTVALALVILGLLNLTGIMRRITQAYATVHSHVHRHDRMHVHVHRHADGPHADHERVSEFIETFGLFHLLRPLVVGLIHGLAGSAAIALLILGSITDQTIAIMYLGIFGVGTVIGMMLITTLLGVPIIMGSKTFETFDRAVTTIAGVVSIGYGLYYGYAIGITGGLFTR